MMKVKVYDNRGATCDRYTVILNAQSDYVGMSSKPFDPQGFGQHGEGCLPGKHLGKRIKFEELPEDCKKLVRRDLLDAVAGVAIVNKDGDIVRTSKNLACIMTHARDFRFDTKLHQDGYTLHVNYSNKDQCSTRFADQTVLRDWISDRVRFGRGKYVKA